MKGIVFIKPIGSHLEPFTTSDIIADCAGVQRSTVSRLVRKHQKDLEEFGFVGFEIRANETVRGIREEKLWHFNEQQATLFITYLQNTEAVREFKKNLVREFFAMRKELEKRKEIHAEGKPIRRSLTDALRDSGEEARMHGHAYGNYTDLFYKAAVGKNAKQLRSERGAPDKATALDFLTSKEMSVYKKKEAAATVLLDAGLRYHEIKSILMKGGRSA